MPLTDSDFSDVSSDVESLSPIPSDSDAEDHAGQRLINGAWYGRGDIEARITAADYFEYYDGDGVDIIINGQYAFVSRGDWV